VSNQSEFTRGELIARLRADGVRVTPSQLHRWTDAGVLPAPKRRGLGRGKGTVSVYPWLSVIQARALHDALKQRRNLDDAAWNLWMFGFPLTDYVRELLLEEWTLLLRASRRASKALADPRIAKRTTEALKRRPGELRNVLESIRPESFPRVSRMFLDMQSGDFDSSQYTDNDYSLAQDTAIALHGPEAADAGDLPTTEVQAAVIHQTTAVPLPKLIARLKELSDGELGALRSEAQALHAWFEAQLGQPPTMASREEFRHYFAKRAVDPSSKPEFRRLFQLLGWKRPPMSPLRKLFTEHEQQSKEA
jgi:hypothetical protein